MGKSPDEPVSGPRWQLGIGIQGDDIANQRKRGKITRFDGEAVRGAKEKVVEVHQLAPLALPAHPASFRGIVDPMTVQVEKAPPLIQRILLIELMNQSGANSDQLIVLVEGLGSVGGISQQGKV